MIRAGGLGLALAGTLAACTVSEQVLGDDDDAPLITCDQVWLSGTPGDPCALPDPCTRDAPPAPGCCDGIQYAYCAMGELVMDTTCNPDCATCVDDHGCVAGAAVCNGMRCEPCPFTDPTGQQCGMTSCPGGWTFLTRNGCPTCECAPPSECELPDGSGCDGGTGDPTLTCYRGARYADPSCAPDDLGCTANVCSFAGCPSPAPLGCFTPCDAAMPPCQMCATESCTCDPNTGAWVCDQICLDGTELSLPCFLP